VDIGTNGEIVLHYEGEMHAASCAAGPAFEGARISQGMRAANRGHREGIASTATSDISDHRRRAGRRALRLGAHRRGGRAAPPAASVMSQGMIHAFGLVCRTGFPDVPANAA
jgi:uncharacterized 2Fe-2S/4Fe-4S cluster protein (DUF4445 family)